MLFKNEKLREHELGTPGKTCEHLATTFHNLVTHEATLQHVHLVPPVHQHRLRDGLSENKEPKILLLVDSQYR